VGVYKPAATGGDPALPHEQDAWRLWDAAGRPGAIADVCPQVFAPPLAPYLAARAEGAEIDQRLLIDGIGVWSDYDLVLVEGLGGLMSPVTANLYVADLAAEFRLPLVVVARNQLGVINQTLQTLIAAETFREPLKVAGIVLNDAAASASDPSVPSNAAELRRHCHCPLLAEVRWHDAGALEGVDWAKLSL
jgi:dethiobiotin synthetase